MFQSAYLLWISYLIPMIRGFMVAQVIIAVTGSAVWIAGIHVDYPARLAPVSTPFFTSSLLGLLGSVAHRSGRGSESTYNGST